MSTPDESTVLDDSTETSSGIAEIVDSVEWSESDIDFDESTRELLVDTPILQLLYPESKMKIILLLDIAERPRSMTDIITALDMSTQTWYNNYETLMDYGVIEVAYTTGNSDLYQLNENSALVALLQQMIQKSAVKYAKDVR
ncbi:hypothetical protein [Halocatena halophila]|uniref:hypothetical protein n=1 Tax=Halocatena halophila TaxID=2814576 RepID=UPI002ED2BB1C